MLEAVLKSCFLLLKEVYKREGLIKRLFDISGNLIFTNSSFLKVLCDKQHSAFHFNLGWLESNLRTSNQILICNFSLTC